MPTSFSYRMLAPPRVVPRRLLPSLDVNIEQQHLFGGCGIAQNPQGQCVNEPVRRVVQSTQSVLIATGDPLDERRQRLITRLEFISQIGAVTDRSPVN